MNVRPLKNNVIIERQEKDLTTASGIILQTNDEADKGLVIAIGPDVTEVNVGDLVLINWNKASKFSDDRWKVTSEEIIAVFE